MTLASIRVPKLLWRLALGSNEPPADALAHSPSVYEILVNGEAGRVALGVDVAQGVLWREVVDEGLVYLGRGLRVEGDRVVDASGSTLLRLRLGGLPEITRGRRFFIATSSKKAKIVDKVLLEIVGEGDAKSLLVSRDEYTLVAVLKTSRKKLTAYVDSIYGSWSTDLKRSPRRVAASHGCSVICTRLGCVVSNGSFTASIAAVDADPLGGVPGYCMVATRVDESRWVILLVGEGVLEAIDSCREKPRTLYADNQVIYYACDDVVKRFNAKTGSVVIEGRAHQGLPTPSKTLMVEDAGRYTLLVLDESEGQRSVIPVEGFYKLYQDKLLAYSAGWLYSTDLSSYEELEAERLELEGCPVAVRIESPSYHILGVDVDDSLRLRKLTRHYNTAMLCLEPTRLSSIYDTKLVVKLAPPLAVEAHVPLGEIRPRLAAKLVSLPDANAVYMKGSLRHLDGHAIIVVRVSREWLEMLRDAVIKLKEGDIVTNEAILDDELVVLPYTGRGKPTIIVELDEYVHEESVEQREEHRIGMLDYTLISMNVTSVDRVAVTIAANADLVLVDREPCRSVGDKFECSLDPYRIPEMCKCKKILTDANEDIYACACEEANTLVQEVRARYAKLDSPLLDTKLWIVTLDNPVARLDLDATEPGIVAVEAVLENSKRAFRAVKLGQGLNRVTLRLPVEEPGVYSLTLRIADKSSIREYPVVALVYRPLYAEIVATRESKILCCPTQCLAMIQGEPIPVKDSCIHLPATANIEKIIGLTSDGDIAEARIRLTMLEKELVKAVRIAETLARYTGLA